MGYDVTTLGELVIDLVPFDCPDGLAFLATPGGAPANVAAGVARLGCASAMISKVGTETFGRAALAALQAAGVHVDAVIRTSAHNTALAVVSKGATGEPDFFFYRENCADSRLSADEIPEGLIASSRILHVGTLALATPISAAAQRRAMAIADTVGVRISADVNFRAAFWRDGERMRAAGAEVIATAHIVKVSEAELHLVSGIPDRRDAARALWRSDLSVLAVTRGAKGAELFTRDHATSFPGFPVTVVDTVGCGDAFMATLLAGMAQQDTRQASADWLQGLAIRCCAAGAITATRVGALATMPTRTEIDDFLRANSFE